MMTTPDELDLAKKLGACLFSAPWEELSEDDRKDLVGAAAATATFYEEKFRRERLPDVRDSVTRKFKIARPGHRNGDLRMYVTVGLYPDGRPGEVFIHSDRTGSLASGALDAVAMCMSVALQHGVPFSPLVEKLRGMRFEPQGMTGDASYPIVTSPLDYVARWLLDRFAGKDKRSDDEDKI